MSETVAMALIAMVGSVVTTVAATVVLFLKTREAVNRSAANRDAIEDVHSLVNSQKALLVQRIATLEAIIRQHDQEKQP
jgi:hypothetical protein